MGVLANNVPEIGFIDLRYKEWGFYLIFWSDWAGKGWLFLKLV